MAARVARRASPASPESAMASRAAITPNWAKRSRPAPADSVKYCSARYGATSAPRVKRRPEHSTCVMGRMPESPARRAVQNSGTVRPEAQKTPIPVMPTRLTGSGGRGLRGGQDLGDLGHDRGDTPERPRVLVGHDDAEVLLDAEEDVQRVERADGEVVERA